MYLEIFFTYKSIGCINSDKISDRFFRIEPEFLFYSIATAISVFVLLYVAFRIRAREKQIELENKIRRRTAELQEANRKLTDDLKLKDRLISLISHDIITPLKFISMVARHSRSNDDQQKERFTQTMEDIEFTSEKLFINASNILNWIKTQNHNIIPVPVHIGLYELVEECLYPLKAMADMKQLALINDVREDLVVHSDRNILTIIIQNLLNNAIKYTEAGSITVSGYEQPGFFRIVVSDTGRGMSEASTKQINDILKGRIDPDKPRDIEDTVNRLGYFIISDLLAYLNADADVKSIQGTGTIAFVTVVKKM